MKPERELVKSARRTLDLLEFIAAAAEPPSFTTLCEQLEIPKSSLFHLLNTMIERKYVNRPERGSGYQLGEATWRLVRKNRSFVPARVQPLLKRLAEELNENAGYYLRDGDNVELAAIELCSQPLMYQERWGNRAPLYAVSSGKVLLAAAASEWLKDYFVRTEFKPFTPNTVKTVQQLQRELVEVQRSGTGRSLEEYDIGVVGVAKGVSLRGVLVGVIAITLPAVRFSAAADARITQALAEVVAEVSRE